MPKKTATPEGAEQQEGGEDEIKTSPTPERNPRNTVLNEIADGFRNARAAELAGDQDEDLEDPDEPDEPDDITDPDAPPREGEEMVTLIVDGVEKEVPQSKIYEVGTRALQKNYAADKRLAEATKLLEEAKQVTKRRQVDDDDEDETAPPSGDDDLRTLAERIQYGSTEEVAEALKELTSRTGGNKELIEAATAQIEEKRSYNEAFEQFKEDFPTIAEDSNLMNMVAQRDSQLLDSGDKRSYHERYTAIGQELTQWLESKGVQTTTREIDKRTQHKRTTSHVSSGGGGRGGEKPPPKPRTRSEVIADIAKARGQQL
jgi:hypothetical protein